MSSCFDEPTIDDLLGDGLTQGSMQADGVDVAALERMLRGLASDRTAAFARDHRLSGWNGPVSTQQGAFV
jgi:hypothetical protein